MQNNLFLRRILALDSLSCLAMGLLLALAAASLAPLFGLPETLLRVAGLALLPVGAFMGWLAARAEPPRPLVWVVIAGNLVWAIESVIILGQFAPTALGTASVSAQAAAVLGITALEYVGLRKAAVAAGA